MMCQATVTPETILEMAYIDNPKLFDRDAATRRLKARADLKAKTGWVDEQIEGWRIMLERNVGLRSSLEILINSYLYLHSPKKINYSKGMNFQGIGLFYPKHLQ